MKHKFYNKSKKERNIIQAIIGLSSLSIILLSIILSWETGIYLISIFTFAILVSIVAPFFDTPALKKSGELIYYSPLFITESPKNGIVKIHGGTLFDYFFVIDKKMNGKQRTNFIIQQYLQGLLNFIEKHESEQKVNLKIIGTSYILNERTAERIGFKIVQTDNFQKIILFYNYFNVLISYSIAKNRVSFPDLHKTKTFGTDLNELIEKKEYIAKLNNRLKNAIANQISKV